jgi:hypothetical protein
MWVALNPSGASVREARDPSGPSVRDAVTVGRLDRPGTFAEAFRAGVRFADAGSDDDAEHWRVLLCSGDRLDADVVGTPWCGRRSIEPEAAPAEARWPQRHRDGSGAPSRRGGERAHDRRRTPPRRRGSGRTPQIAEDAVPG